MRKLIKESNKVNTLVGIAATCACRAICRNHPDLKTYQANVQDANNLQMEHAHTGTMPQGIVNEN